MLFTMRRRQDSTPTPMPPLRAPACGVDNGSGQQQNGTMADDRDNGAGPGVDSEAKMMAATSTPPPQAAARGVEMSNWHGEDEEGTMTKKKGSHNDRDGDGEYDNAHMTKTAAAANDEGNDEHRTRTEGAGYGAV